MKKKDEKFAVVVAHPDDEILFASSIIDKASQIFICFSEIKVEQEIHILQNIGRKNIKKKYPLENVTFLGLTQASNKNAKKLTGITLLRQLMGLKAQEMRKNINQIFIKSIMN